LAIATAGDVVGGTGAGPRSEAITAVSGGSTLVPASSDPTTSGMIAPVSVLRSSLVISSPRS
jgi:hypothetical protein